MAPSATNGTEGVCRLSFVVSATFRYHAHCAPSTAPLGSFWVAERLVVTWRLCSLYCRPSSTRPFRFPSTVVGTGTGLATFGHETRAMFCPACPSLPVLPGRLQNFGSALDHQWKLAKWLQRVRSPQSYTSYTEQHIQFPTPTPASTFACAFAFAFAFAFGWPALLMKRDKPLS